MTNPPQIRLAKPTERNALLQFIQTMGFNPRDATTWDALKMTAMSAWQGTQLIGAIPLEPRLLRLTNDHTAPTFHETVVAVHPDYRNRGIGSAMQEKLFTDLATEAELISVFREEPQSPAYRWYIKNGFAPAMHIDSWFFEGQTTVVETQIDLFFPGDIRIPWPTLPEIWNHARQRASGFVDQTHRPLQSWLPVHPYRHRYEFRIAMLDDRSDCYAVLGIGQMHSEAKRCDILDFIPSDDQSISHKLLQQILQAVEKLGCKSTRWPLAETDPNTALAQQAGFQKKWGFEMLVRPAATFAFDSYAGIDYI